MFEIPTRCPSGDTKERVTSRSLQLKVKGTAPGQLKTRGGTLKVRNWSHYCCIQIHVEMCSLGQSEEAVGLRM
jgi:hypothetical protein